MGATEEAGKVASGIVDSLKSQPLVLALIVINVLFLAMFVWIAHEVATTNRIERTQRDTLIQELQKTCDACRQRMEQR